MQEIFKDIAGYEGLYQVSNFGRVKSVPRPIHLPHGGFSIRKERFLSAGNVLGYLRVVLTKNSVGIQYSVHRLVACAFIPNPENKREVNHINSTKTDNNLSNLEWVTRNENLIHSYKMGTHPSKAGILNGRSKLTEDQVRDIRKEYSLGGISTITLGKKYGVYNTSINRIISGETWGHIN